MTELSTHVFELDLTSVCVSTGVVQLPMKMQPFFTNGAIQATVDGESVALEFSGPRRLGGFKLHFEQRGLRANDRLHFELDAAQGKVVSLRAACIKRERSKPALVSRLGDSQAATGGSGSAGERAPGQAETVARGGESSGWDSANSVRAVRRVTIMGSDAPPPRYEAQAARSTGSSQPGATPTSAERPASSSWRALDGLTPGGLLPEPSEADYRDTVVRAIRRRPAGAAPVPLTEELSGTRPGAEAPAPVAERHASAPATDTDPAPSYEPQRMRLADLVAPPEASATPARAQRSAAARPRIFALRGPRVEHGAAGVASLTPGSAQAAPSAGPTSAPELIEERELVPVARPTVKSAKAETAASQGAAADATGHAGGRASGGAVGDFARGVAPQSSPQRPDGLGRNGGAGFGAASATPRAPAMSETRPEPQPGSPDTKPRMTIDDASFGGSHEASGGVRFGAGLRTGEEGFGGRAASAVADGLERRGERQLDADDLAFERALKKEFLDKRNQPIADRQPSAVGPSQGLDGANGAARQVADRQQAPGAQAPSGTATSTAPVVPATAATPGKAAPATPTAAFAPVQEMGSVEDAVKQVRAYLDRPSTPAIVRSDLVAVELGLDPHRCELALERLAENRERISRIRKGAYMIRRDATRRDEAHL